MTEDLKKTLASALGKQLLPPFQSQANLYDGLELMKRLESMITDSFPRPVTPKPKPSFIFPLGPPLARPTPPPPKANGPVLFDPYSLQALQTRLKKGNYFKKNTETTPILQTLQTPLE